MLPETVFNYLLRLGWGHGDAEIISRDEAIEWFDIGGVGRSPSRFDLKKLENLNGHYLREADDERLAALVGPRVAKLIGRALATDEQALLVRAMPELKPRAKTLDEIAEGAAFLFAARPLALDEKATALLQGDAPTLLGKTHDALAAVCDWTAERLEEAVRQVAEEAGIGLGKVAQPLRAALTGRTTSPGIFDVLVLLGRAESLARLADVAQGNRGSAEAQMIKE
jgi:glutamyl-tRNA synthetase